MQSELDKRFAREHVTYPLWQKVIKFSLFVLLIGSIYWSYGPDRHFEKRIPDANGETEATAYYGKYGQLDSVKYDSLPYGSYGYMVPKNFFIGWAGKEVCVAHIEDPNALKVKYRKGGYAYMDQHIYLPFAAAYGTRNKYMSSSKNRRSNYRTRRGNKRNCKYYYPYRGRGRR